ncbi:hypothetical protein NLG97_g247 [Lecanicillium saksenae]|uniref:Uncharacterized protein n=1 Tax=Lecanicillium saksenae TaxID=468837 RepID=A0ACC1R720_9HYPO|nr:hypothetical protein NLG97_g247 [Lecanicillium saksenae]
MSSIIASDLASPSQVDGLWEQAVQRYQQDSSHAIPETVSRAPVTATTLIDEIRLMDSTFRKFRNNGSKLDKLRETLNRCLPLIEALGEVTAHATKTVFPPAEAIFAAVRHLIKTAHNVTNDYDRLADFFEEVTYYLEGVQVLDNQVSSIPELNKAIIDVMSSVLALFVKSLKSLVIGEDTELKDAYQHFTRMVDRERDIVRRSTQSIVERLGHETREVRDNTMQTLASTQRLENNMISLTLSNKIVKDNSARKLDFIPIQQEILAKHHLGTGRWLLDSRQFNAWWQDENVFSIWCTGDPGTGKSVLMSMAIHHVEEKTLASNTAIAFVYCDYRDSKTQDAPEILSSIVKQFVEQSCILHPEVEAFRDRHMSMRSKRPTERDYLALIITLSKRFNKTFVFIDALDECSEINRDKLLPCLQALQIWTRLFVTSRLSVELTGKLTNNVRIDVTAHDSDVKAFISAKLASGATRISRALAKDHEIEDTIINSIVDHSNGMFLLAHFQLEHVCSQRNLAGVRKALNSHTPDLNQFYDSSIERLKQLPPADSEVALKALCFVFCARRQLSLDELLHALGVVDWDEDFDHEAIDDEEVFLGLLLGLVRVDDRTRLVRLTHLTLHDYLRTHHEAFLLQYEKQLSNACLTYLSFNIFTSGPCGDIKMMSERLKTYCLYDYASRYWAAHAMAHVYELLDKIITFLQSDGKLGAAVQSAYLPPSQVVNRHMHYPKGFTSIHAAAFWGLGAVVELLLSGAGKDDIDATDSYAMTPLLLSARCGHLEATERLLAKNANVEAQNNRSETALVLAAKNGHASVVKVLIANGARQSVVDDEGWTALNWAIIRQHIDTVKVLLGCDTSLQSNQDLCNKALHLAAEAGSAELVTILADEGADVNSKNDQGSTPLHWCVPPNFFETTQALLHKGADSNEPDKYGHRPLHWAITDSTITRLLVEHGAMVDSKTNGGETPLLWSTLAGQIEVMATLLDLDASIDAQNQYGFTALHAAAFTGSLEAARQLIHRGANCNIKDKDGWTALQTAIVKGKHELVELLKEVTHDGEKISRQVSQTLSHLDVLYLMQEMAARKATRSVVVSGLRNVINSGWTSRLLALLEDGADINAIDEIGGMTALTHAAWLGAEDMVSLLLEHGANINLRDRDDRTALHWATEGTYAGLVEILLDHGAEIDIRVNGWTPLLLAGRKWDGLAAQILSRRGADLNAQDFHGRSVLHWFTIHGCRDTVSFLLQSGADVNKQDHCGQTALHWAVASNYPIIVRRLLRGKVSASVQADDGSTAMHIAAYTGRLDIVTLLLSDKTRRERRRERAAAEPQAEDLGVVDLAATDANGMTAETVATLAGHEEVVGVLRAASRGEPAAECNGSCDAPARHMFHRPRPRIQLRRDPESDYLQIKDGISIVGIRLMNDDVQLWLCERSKLVHEDDGC